MRYDLAITGSGGAAFAAAITARDAGASVVMIERGTVGGTCVNTGCVPSKALLAAAAARHDAASQRFPGITTQAGPVDMAALTGGKDDLVAAMRASKYTGLAADYGWEIIAGTARFSGGPDAPVLQVRLSDGGTTTVEAGQYLVATGAAPWIPPISGLTGAGYLTSTTAMELTGLPESMLVIGGNAVGLELAQLFARLGVTVTIAEALDRLAPFDEPEVSAAIEKVLHEEGIGILTAATITSVQGDATARSVTIRTAGGPERELAYGQILVAAGRRPDNAGRTLDYTALPRVTFTSPAIASAGITEAELVRDGVACDCRVLPLSAVPRAIVSRDTRGVVKLVAEAGTGRVRGVHAVADGAAEMITAASYAIRARMTVTDLAAAWAPYLTMSESLRLAAQAFSRDVSRLSCCAT